MLSLARSIKVLELSKSGKSAWGLMRKTADQSFHLRTAESYQPRRSIPATEVEETSLLLVKMVSYNQ